MILAHAAAAALLVAAAPAPEGIDADALVRAGFADLRAGRPADARAAFERVVAIAPGYADAWFGLALAAERLGAPEEARGHVLRALALDPARDEFREARQRIARHAPDPPPPVQRPASPRTDARVSRARGFEVPGAEGFRPLFVKGVNLGAALPGRHPSEFPRREVYRQWIREMAEVGFNAVRVYTIHPPHFYEELEAWNRAARRPLWLVHGVWAEPPPGDDFSDPRWSGAWRSEMERVVDLLHGRANLPERRGHASGVYRADVSRWTLAYILGREWEPDGVAAYDERHPGTSDFRGRFVVARGVRATERAMAEALEHLLAYEEDTYATQRPAAFTSWPTLDPLVHPTESTKAEEARIRQRLGVGMEPGRRIVEYDNDAVALDMERFTVGPRARAGLFASTHAYPYYPDFMNLDPSYAKGRDHLGPSHYAAYLRDLVRHHRRHAVLVAEFGVPSSRLVAHWQPQGLTHGGQGEREQGEQDARLFRNVRDSGCAGGILFAWIDEWFKKNWLVIDAEEPLERKPLWYNVQDAEENYGLVAYRPGASGPALLIDGRPEDWERVPPVLAADGLVLKVLGDEGWLHLGIFWREGSLDPERQALLVGIDTLDPGRGNHRFPFDLPLRSAAGLEFVAVFQGERGAVLADAPYDLFTYRYMRPWRTTAHEGGPFVMPRTESNRMRFGRDGTRFPPHVQEIGWLRRGTQDRTSPAFDDRAEWQRGPGFLEARVPWGLLNVTDPSSRRVVEDPPGRDWGGAGTAVTDGFRLAVVAYEAEDFRRTGAVSQVLPAAEGGVVPVPPTYAWPTWEEPTFHAYRKRSFDIVREALRALPDEPLSRPEAR